MFNSYANLPQGNWWISQSKRPLAKVLHQGVSGGLRLPIDHPVVIRPGAYHLKSMEWFEGKKRKFYRKASKIHGTIYGRIGLVSGKLSLKATNPLTQGGCCPHSVWNIIYLNFLHLRFWVPVYACLWGHLQNKEKNSVQDLFTETLEEWKTSTRMG